ncbi:MAG: hypothetical protein ACXWDP_03225 [Solirubrobacterales bacterium]
MFGSISKQEHARIMEHGEHAQAVILDSKTMALGSAPIRFAKLGGVRSATHAVTVHLRVEPKDKPPFEVRKRFRFPEHTLREPGDRLDVVFDPNDTEQMILDPDSWAGSKPRRS